MVQQDFIRGIVRFVGTRIVELGCDGLLHLRQPEALPELAEAQSGQALMPASARMCKREPPGARHRRQCRVARHHGTSRKKRRASLREEGGHLAPSCTNSAMTPKKRACSR